MVSRAAAHATKSQLAQPTLFDDAELEALMASCDRFLVGHGPRHVASMLATIPTDTKADFYGAGGVVSELESELALLLGKPASLFLPSGTMAQQATLRVHVDRMQCRNVVFHSTCHLATREEHGYKLLHRLSGIPLGSLAEPLSANMLKRVDVPVGALLIELPQRELGGTLPNWGELARQVGWARERGAALHLDGARLWEAGPFYASVYNKSLADVAALFDTVYVSFYKGLGGIAGCCVAGDQEVIDELAVWRTRHGGRCFMMWPYAASALTVLRRRLPSMVDYYCHARDIAEMLRGVPGVEVLPTEVWAPLLHLRIRLSLDDLRERLVNIAHAHRVWMVSRVHLSEAPELQRLELSVGDATLELAAAEVRELFETLTGP